VGEIYDQAAEVAGVVTGEAMVHEFHLTDTPVARVFLSCPGSLFMDGAAPMDFVADETQVFDTDALK
jgi:hypothetical protein